MIQGDDGHSQRLSTHAHLFNEPSPSSGKPNVGIGEGRICALLNEDGRYDDRATVCGEAVVFHTTRPIAPGGELQWCYGEGYLRTYPVARVCAVEGVRLGQTHAARSE